MEHLNARRIPAETASQDGSLQQDGDFSVPQQARQFTHDV
jgi:hypothetical protein